MSLLLATAYFPPVSYMAEVVRADQITLEAWETYPKQTLRNRCLIYGPNGRQSLIIPVNRVNGNHTLTRDIQISDHCSWQKTHWRTIETAYNNSPFFLFYQDHFIRVFTKRHKYLLDLNLEIFRIFIRILNIEKPVALSEKYNAEPLISKDLRNIFSGKKTPALIPIIPYSQVFMDRHGFIPGLSFLDLLFNLGPESLHYLQTMNKISPGH
jgi:hypothetical protein